MINLLRAIVEHGGFTVLFIALISLGSMTLVIERSWRLWPLQRRFQAIRERCQETMLRSGLRAALAELTEDDPMARVLRGGLAAHERGGDTMRAAALGAAQREVPRLERGLGLIQTAAQIAPWLGLLGTVAGLMEVFGSVGDKANVTHAVAATGIYQALSCTIAGLAVAIGSYVAYQLLSGLSSRLVDELEYAASDLPVFAAGAKAYMALRRRHGGQRAALDFTALVDIALVLVVYFVLASQAAQSRDLPVSLPQAGTGSKPAPNTLDLVIDASGGLSFQGRALETADLAKVAQGQPRVTLLADKQARHGRVVEVVDALRKLGVQEIYYATAAGVEEW